MMRLARLLMIVLAAGLVTQAPLAANGRGQGGAPKVKASSAKPVKVNAPKAGGATKVNGKPSTARASGKAAKPTKSPASSSASLTKKNSTTTTVAATTGATSGPDTTTSIGPELNSKLQSKLGEDSKHALRLAAKLNLPEGITVQQAAAGFSNWGRFNSAVNVSNKLGIPFNDLKAALTGWTLPNVHTGDATPTMLGTMSLGQAQKAFRDGTLPTYPSPELPPTTPTPPAGGTTTSN